MSERTTRLFDHLLWPAAAGNVAWSFFNVLVTHDGPWHVFVAQLATLGLLAWYLFINWRRSEVLDYKAAGYWFFDGIHLVTVVLFAIVTAEIYDISRWLLMAVLGWAALGHAVGAFDRVADEPVIVRCKRVGANGLGIALILSSILIPELAWLAPPLAVVLVLVVWGFVKGY